MVIEPNKFSGISRTVNWTSSMHPKWSCSSSAPTTPTIVTSKKVHTAEQIFKGTKAIVETIQKRHPETKILVLRIFPRGGDDEMGISPPAFNSSAKCIETCRRAGELTRRLADNKKVFWLDINHIFLQADGRINTKLMWDLLHPSPTGAETWVNAIMPTLRKLLRDKQVTADQRTQKSAPPTSNH